MQMVFMLKLKKESGKMLKTKTQIEVMILDHIKEIDSLIRMSDKETTAELMKARSMALASLVELRNG